MVALDAFPAGGVHGTLAGTGDTAVIWVSSGPGESPTFTLTGAAELCSRLTFAAVAPEGVSTLHGVCPHRSSWPLTPSTPALPIVVFNRTGAAHQFTLSRTG